MAKEIDLLSMIDLKESAKNTLEGEDLFVADARARYKYEDNKRTDTVVGTTVTLQVVRESNNPLSSQTFEMQTDQILDPDEIFNKSVAIEIKEVKIWASSRRNSTYSEPRVTLKGVLTFGGEQ